MYKVFNAVTDTGEGYNGRGCVCVCVYRWVKAEGECLFIDVYVCEFVQRSSERVHVRHCCVAEGTGCQCAGRAVCRLRCACVFL